VYSATQLEDALLEYPSLVALEGGHTTMISLLEFFETIYAPLKLRGKSENTTRLYHCTLRSFAKFLQRQPTLGDLDDLSIARFLTKRASERSAFTAEKERTQLLSLARFAHDRGLIKTRPCVPPATLPERIPTAWTIDQIRSLIRATDKEVGMVDGVPTSLYFRALVSVLWETAERIGAVMGTQVLDYQNGMLLVRSEYRKGRKRDKLYSLTLETQHLVDQVCRGKKQGQAIFSWDKMKTLLWHSFGRIVKRAGLDGGRKTKFHMIRRSAATHYAARGGDATAMLDHSSPRIAKAYYVDPRFIETGPKPCDVLPKIG
jgi:integrase